MSYVRWGSNGSSVYVILCTYGYLECVGCNQEGNQSHKTDAFIGHLKRHIQRGDCVPEYVIPNLIKDKGENDAWIKRQMKARKGSPRVG